MTTCRLSHGLLLLLVLVLAGYSSAASADAGSGSAAGTTQEADSQCERVQASLELLLNMRLTKSDKKLLAHRRKNLNKLFGKTTRSCAKTLRKRLGEKRNKSDISRLFHYKLARPVRKELLAVLDRRSRLFFRSISDGTSNQAAFAEN